MIHTLALARIACALIPAVDQVTSATAPKDIRAIRTFLMDAMVSNSVLQVYLLIHAYKYNKEFLKRIYLLMQSLSSKYNTLYADIDECAAKQPPCAGCKNKSGGYFCPAPRSLNVVALAVGKHTFSYIFKKKNVFSLCTSYAIIPLLIN
jgi:hypothetical protein